MTDQLTRIERMVNKIVEAAERIEEACNEIKEKMPEEFYDIKEQLGQITEAIRDKSKDAPNYGIGGEINN
jgi:predicted  nucleic acid-binding Zn-ribbon protein